MADGASSISVAVRVRPFSDKERQQLSTTYGQGPTLFSSGPDDSATLSTPQPNRAMSGSVRKVLKVLDDRILVFDPPESNALGKGSNGLPLMGKKNKDIRFCFDRVFDEDCGQDQVYDGSAKELVGHVMNGFHSTVFAYGATGCGKTHTISGSSSQPGIVFLIMKDLFARISAKSADTDFSLKVSYLEIYNETIRDLLAPETGVLQLREANGTAHPAGLSSKEPSCATDVVEWITLGNANRTVNATEANATSSRSHAVLQVSITQKPKASGLTDTQSSATLSVIDLAGSERASVTKNKGDRLIEGANINRSLLALGNCINALCDPRKRGHVPYRDSKLTRLLKQSLGGNCKTVMIVCVSPSSAHYDETHNTLQYANRAKEIKTKAIRNVINVDRHVAQYCQQIMQQNVLIERLRAELASNQTSAGIADHDDDLAAVKQAVQRVYSTYEAGRAKKVAAEQAAAEKSAVETVMAILKTWKSTALSGAEASPGPGSSSAAASLTINNVRFSCEGLVNSLQSSVAKLASVIASGHDAMMMYEAQVQSALRNMRNSRPAAADLFALEIRVFAAQLESHAANARETGAREGMKTQARAMNAICDARAKAGTAVDQARAEGDVAERALRRLTDAIDSANRHAFLSLSFESLNSTKRDAGSRSPLYQNSWELTSPRKSPRSAASGLGSAPSGTLAVAPPAPPSPRTRESPRRPVSMASRAARPSSVKKAKGVQWRDETGDGWKLEDVKINTPDTSSSALTTDSPSTPSLSVSPAPRPAPQRVVSAPTHMSWTVSSAVSSGLSSAAAAMAQAARARPAMRALGGGKRMSMLPPVAENGKPFSFADSPDPASRRPFGDLGNTSMGSIAEGGTPSHSMAGPSGLYAPVVAQAPPTPRTALALSRARRVSSLGPQRSEKPNRRSSYGAAPLVVAPTPSRKPLRASRVLGGTTFVAPGSVRKSPRKGVNRRLSTLPSIGGAPTTVAAPFGMKSEARLQARRESTMPGGPAAGLGGIKRDSPTLGVTAPKAGVWR